MAPKAAVALLLAATILSTTQGARLSPQTSSERKLLQSSYDYLFLVQQWPGTCFGISGGCCNNNGYTEWTLHGLWPNYNNGRFPSSCDPNNPYDNSEISDLMSSIQNNWPTFSCHGGEASFLGHEWSKHGTCTENVIADDGSGNAEHAYFNAALNLHGQNDIYNTLANASITPGDSYSLSSVTDALSAAFGTAYVQCDKKGNLWQAFTCFDPTAATPQDCPTAPGGDECPDTVYYPTDGDNSLVQQQ